MPREEEVQVYYGDTDSLLLKVKTEKFLKDLETAVHISSSLDYMNWNESIYPELVKHQAPNQLLMLKSETGSDLISNGVFPGLKVYFVETHDKDVKQACKGVPTHIVINNFEFSSFKCYLQDLLLKVEHERENSNGFIGSPNLLKKKVSKPSFFQKLKAKFSKEQHSTERLEGLGECFTMTLNPGELLRFSAVQTRKDSDSDAAASALLERRKSLTELLNMIYNEARKRNSSGNCESDNGTEYSTTSDYTGNRRNYEVENINEWRLKNKDINELHIVVNQLSSSINHVVLQLIRQLKRRDKLRNKMEKNCDIITAYLQAISPKRSQDTRLRFSIDPPKNDTGYTQWHDAMRMVARLQEGIPQDFRRRLWLSLANNYIDSRQIKWYDVERKCFSGTINTTDEELGQQILKDLHRTGCSLFCGDYAEENQAVLKRVLLAFARWNKRVGYCQGFNMLAAIILGVMLGNESDSLKVMVFLVEGVLPNGYFGENLRGLSIDMAVFRELLRLRLPELSAHLDMLQHDGADTQGTTYEPPLTNVFTMQWFLTLFSTCLPKDSVLRIWDLIFLEGNEVLLRTALALWDSLVDRILAVQSADEFYSIMGVLAREMAEFSSSDTNDLLKTIVEVAPFPFPGLHELREKYTYSLTPWSQSVVSVAKKGLRLIYSDDDDSDSEVKEMTVATAFGLGNMKSPRSRRHSCARPHSSSPASSEDRRNLDIISLTKQYKKLRERQKQAQILWNDTTRKIKDGAQKITPTSVNQLIVTEVNLRSRIENIETKPDGPLIMRTHFSSVRLQPQEKLKISEKRQHEKGKNISCRRSFSNENSSSSSSTELCDDDDVPRLSDLDSPGRSPAKSPSLQYTSRRVDDVMKENLEILNRLRKSNSSDSVAKYFSPFPIDRNQQRLNHIRSSMERK